MVDYEDRKLQCVVSVGRGGGRGAGSGSGQGSGRGKVTGGGYGCRLPACLWRSLVSLSRHGCTLARGGGRGRGWGGRGDADAAARVCVCVCRTSTSRTSSSRLSVGRGARSSSGWRRCRAPVTVCCKVSRAHSASRLCARGLHITLGRNRPQMASRTSSFRCAWNGRRVMAKFCPTRGRAF